MTRHDPIRRGLLLATAALATALAACSSAPLVPETHPPIVFVHGNGDTAGLWLTTIWHRLDVTLVALGGLAVLLVTGTMTSQNAAAERSAWDVFIWYGGMLQMGELLNATGSTRIFAENVAGLFGGIPWQVVLVAILIIFFYAHYFFASITAHMLAMFPPFVAVLIGIGVPPQLAVFSLLCLANLTAGLTHYGTTTGPILFGTGYVTRVEWWKAGFWVSVANMVIWLTAGFAWWKFLGFW